VAYTTAATGGATSFTFNRNGTQSDVDCWLVEYHLSSGTISYDNSNGYVNTVDFTNPNAPSLTVSGTNEVVFNIGSFQTSCSAIATPWNNPSEQEPSSVAGCIAAAINQSSYSVMTWVGGSGNTNGLGVIAFKAPVPARHHVIIVTSEE
jgi:hypothetical protein